MSRHAEAKPEILSSRWIPTRRAAARIALSYALFGALWIVFSGWVLHVLVKDPFLVRILEHVKGWFFVAVTAWLLGLVLDRQFASIRHAARLLQDGNEKLQLAQDSALASSARLEAALASMTDAVFICDAEGKFTHFNQAFVTFYRFKDRSECRASFENYPTFLEALGADGKEAPLEQWSAPRALRGETATGAEYTLRRKDTGETWVGSYCFAPIRNKDGLVVGCVVTARDITEQKRVEAALRESEAEFRAAFEVASIGMAQADAATGKWLRINDKMCAITGYSTDELLKMTACEVTHPDDRERDGAARRRVARGEGADFQIDRRYLRKDGAVVWVSANVALVRDASGRAVRTVEAVEDISERIRADTFRHALLTLGARLNNTCSATAAGRALLDTADRLWNWSAATLSLVVPGADRPHVVLKVDTFGTDRREIVANDEAVTAAWQLEVNDRPAHARASVMSAPIHRDEQVVGSLVIESDMANAYSEADRQALQVLADYCGGALERIRSEVQLRQAQKVEAIGQLAGGVAHDFNNILAAIMMHTGLIQTGLAAGADILQSVNDIEMEARRAAGLTQQLLVFSRRSVLAIKPLDLNEAVTNLLKMLSRIIGEQIEMRFEGESGLPLVDADSGMMDQVLMNLVVNARDAMPNGGTITIRTCLEEIQPGESARGMERRAGRFVCLCVSDTGSGMTRATMKRIFEPFFTTKEAGKGTGLGLATVQGIVAQHHGWIEVDSAMGSGSTFRVFLPITSQTSANPSFHVSEAVRPGKETILLVEDSPPLRRVVARSLRALGYRVYEAGNGQDALRIWQMHRSEVDLLFTDMIMPEGVTGLDLVARLSAEKPSLRSIVSSGYSAELVQATGVATRAGITYLPKPYEARVLSRTVRNCLDGIA